MDSDTFAIERACDCIIMPTKDRAILVHAQHYFPEQ